MFAGPARLKHVYAPNERRVADVALLTDVSFPRVQRVLSRSPSMRRDLSLLGTQRVICDLK